MFQRRPRKSRHLPAGDHRDLAWCKVPLARAATRDLKREEKACVHQVVCVDRIESIAQETGSALWHCVSGRRPSKPLGLAVSILRIDSTAAFFLRESHGRNRNSDTTGP